MTEPITPYIAHTSLASVKNEVVVKIVMTLDADILSSVCLQGKYVILFSGLQQVSGLRKK